MTLGFLTRKRSVIVLGTLALAIGLFLALLAARVEAVHSLFFSEAFTTDLGPNLEDLDAAFIVSGGAVQKTSWLGNEARSYVRTIRTDYASSDWVYTIDVNLVGHDIVFIGVGEGVPNAPGSGPTYNEPRNAIFFRIHSKSFGGGGTHVAVMETAGWTDFPTSTIPALSADGLYTARIESSGATSSSQSMDILGMLAPPFQLS